MEILFTSTNMAGFYCDTRPTHLLQQIPRHVVIIAWCFIYIYLPTATTVKPVTIFSETLHIHAQWQSAISSLIDGSFNSVNNSLVHHYQKLTGLLLLMLIYEACRTFTSAQVIF